MTHLRNTKIANKWKLLVDTKPREENSRKSFENQPNMDSSTICKRWWPSGRKINIVDDDVRRSKLQDLRSKPVSSLCDESASYPSTYFSALQFEAFWWLNNRRRGLSLMGWQIQELRSTRWMLSHQENRHLDVTIKYCTSSAQIPETFL